MTDKKDEEREHSIPCKFRNNADDSLTDHTNCKCWCHKKTKLFPPKEDIDDYDYGLTPEGYDDSPDQGVHRFDGGGSW